MGHPRRESRWVVVFLFAFALGIRVAHVIQIQASPLFDHPVVDAETYTQLATSLARGNWLARGQGPFWQPPLYPYLLGVLKSLSPDSFFRTVRMFQAICGALTCLLTYRMGRRLFGPRIGFLAGLAASLYGPLIFFDGELLPATLAALLNVSAMMVTLRALDRRSIMDLTLAGAMFGLSAITVSTVILFIAGAAAWIYWRFRDSQGLRLASAFLLGVVLTILPVSLRNLSVGKDAVIVSYNGGVNFFIGNNADYPRTLDLRPGWEWEDLAGRPLALGITRPSEKSAFFLRESWNYIRTHPFGYCSLLLRKTGDFMNGDERGRNQAIYYWRRYSTILALTLWKHGLAFPFGLVAPLAVLGLALDVRRRGMSLPTLYVILYALGVVLFFVTSRYRIPAIPFLLIFATYGGSCLIQWIKDRQIKSAFFGSVAVVVLAVVSNYDLLPMDMTGDAAIHNNLGDAYLAKSQLNMALEEYRYAVKLDPEYWQARYNLGVVHARQKQMPAAIQLFEEVVEARPRQEEVWLDLAHAQLMMNQRTAARETYNRAIQADPKLRKVYLELILLHLQAGQEDQARMVLQRAIDSHPREVDALRATYQKLLADVKRSHQ